MKEACEALPGKLRNLVILMYENLGGTKGDMRQDPEREPSQMFIPIVKQGLHNLQSQVSRGSSKLKGNLTGQSLRNGKSNTKKIKLKRTAD